MATCEPRREVQITRKSYLYPLLADVHRALSPPTGIGETFYTRGNLKYFHYNCDGTNDIGWGCGYRTLQTAISWIMNERRESGSGDGSNGDVGNAVLDARPPVNDVPSIKEVQEILTSINDKPESFVGSNSWIGTLEEFYTIDMLFAVPCKILHVQLSMSEVIEQIRKYFMEYSGFIMMGGMEDSASKGVAGIHLSGDGVYLLIVDPHFIGVPSSVQELISAGFVRWMHVAELENNYYNLCLPLLK